MEFLHPVIPIWVKSPCTIEDFNFPHNQEIYCSVLCLKGAFLVWVFDSFGNGDSRKKDFTEWMTVNIFE